MNRVEIGNKMRQLRGNTPRIEVAQAIGVSLPALAMYETGERVPKDDIKIKIAKYFNISVGEIFFEQ